MKFSQGLFISTLGVAATCILVGSTIKQPWLRGLAEVVLLGAICKAVLVKQDKLARFQQQQLSRLIEAHTDLQGRLTDTDRRLDKFEKKLNTHHTSQRLYLSKMTKLDRQQKVTLATLAQVQARLSCHPVAETQSHLVKARKSQLRSFPQQPSAVTRIYIDGNNLNFAADSLPIEIDYNALRVELSQAANITTLKYYTGVLAPISDGQKGFISYLERLGFEVFILPVLHHANSHSFKTVGDDVKIVVDMLQEVRSHDRVILVSGDGDFIPAIEELQKRGAKVTVVAKKGMLSQQLSEVVDEVIFLDDIQDRIAKYTKLKIG